MSHEMTGNTYSRRDIDAEAFDQVWNTSRIEEERAVYARLQALTGNFIVVYVVDPQTGN